MYKAFFGLRAKPFRLNPDTRLLFASRGAQRALTFLKYGLYQREGLVLLTGDTGVGKSLLVRNLLERLPRDSLAVAQVAAPRCSGSELLGLIAAGFGIDPDGRSRAVLLQSLKRQLIGHVQAGRRALLIVDEAHNLSADALEEIRLLSGLQVGTASLTQIFLVGQPPLRRTLLAPEAAPLRQRILAADHLAALDLDETARYVLFRLQRVGWEQASPFDDAAIRGVHAASGGTARRINALCERLLMQAFVEGRRTIGGSDVATVVAEIDDEWSPRLAMPAPGSVAGATQDDPVAAAGAASITRVAQARHLGRVGSSAAAPTATGSTMIADGVDPSQADDELDDRAAAGPDGARLRTLEARMAALETSTAQVAKVSRAILGRIDAGKPL